MACTVAITFDEMQVLVKEMRVEGLNGDEVQSVASQLLGQIIPQIEAVAIVHRMGKVIEQDSTVEAQFREEILARLDELKQVLVVREPKWKAARELLAFVADIASVAPLVSQLQQILPMLRL